MFSFFLYYLMCNHMGSHVFSYPLMWNHMGNHVIGNFLIVSFWIIYKWVFVTLRNTFTCYKIVVRMQSLME